MEKRLLREKIADEGLDFFVSKEFLKAVKPKSLEQLKSLMMAQKMLTDALDYIKNTAPHAYIGKLNTGIDYSTGYFKGDRNLELFFYHQQITMTKAEFIFEHPAPITEEVLKEIMPYNKIVLPPRPLGYGVDFWANDCFGRVSKIRVLPTGDVKEQKHGRANMLLRDPVNALTNLPWDKKNHDFYYALQDEGLMHILKETDEHDKLLLTCNSYNEMVGKLTQKLAESQFSIESS